MVTQRRRRGDSPRSGHDDIDGVLCHFAVGGELAAGHRHHAVAGRADRVSAREVGRALRDVPALGRWRQEGTQPGPEAGDVSPGEVRGGDGVGGIEQVVDVLGGTGGIVQRAGVVRVGGAEIDEVRLRPRHDEDGPLVLGDRDDRGDVARQPAGRHGDVDALGRPDRVRILALVEGPHVVGPDARGVDDDPRPDREFRGLVVGHRSDNGAVGGPVRAGRQADDRGVVGHDGAELVGRRARHREGQAGIVGPGVEVEEPGHEVAGAEGRQMRQRLLLRDFAVAFPDAPPAGEVVEPQRGGVRAGHGFGDDAVAAEEGNEKREWADQVRCIVQEVLSFGQILVDESELALLEVAEPAVDHLR